MVIIPPNYFEDYKLQWMKKSGNEEDLIGLDPDSLWTYKRLVEELRQKNEYEDEEEFKDSKNIQKAVLLQKAREKSSEYHKHGEFSHHKKSKNKRKRDESENDNEDDLVITKKRRLNDRK